MHPQHPDPRPKTAQRVYGDGQTGRIVEVFYAGQITIRWADGTTGSYDLDDIEITQTSQRYAGIDRVEWRLKHG